MTTIYRVNQALADKGIKAELKKGKGYFYFIGNDVDRAKTTSVMTAQLNSRTVEEWVLECQAIIFSIGG